MDLTTSLQKLASYRPQQTKKSRETFEKGVVLLRTDAFAKQGEAGWDALERLTLAAFDQTELKVADQCLQRISNKFPQSPRVDLLQGIRMEVTEPPEVALKYYDELLQEDSTRAAIWRRKAYVLRRMGKIDRAVEELSAMLDTFYTDVEGWLELADTYASCQQYTYALQSLSHALLLSPQNPFCFLQFAETAYLAGDITLSLKMFLVAVDMTDDEEGVPQDSIPVSLTLRAWYGVKLCTHRLITEPRHSSSSASQTPAPTTAKLANLDELSTERLRTAYLNVKGASPPNDHTSFMSTLATVIH
ncbi:TPR-like protein [Sparassis latifolia]|uniref:ER membrane protein complex subunit 2 n=1 Tax=Sparassis crispa TaxID=139825 RepID=A0A401GMF7_9APHY|nr:TPR repeat protein [Sparassis crispa]GBE83403.1 TPR repeat protein [Sparassis crispa]